MMQNKRFIAGAVCPRCGEMDRLVTFERQDSDGKAILHKECVSCGYEEKQLAQVEQNELPTRVNQFEEQAADGEAVTVLNFYENKKSDSSES